MKKVLLLICSGLIGLSSFGQVSSQKLADPTFPMDDLVIKNSPLLVNKNIRRAPNSGWFGSADATFTSMGVTPTDNGVFYMHPDSTAQIMYTNGEGRIRWHAIGQTFDPKFEFYSITDVGFNTSRFMSYSLDSLRLRKSYIRQVDSFDFGSGNEEVIDTLYIEYFRNNNLSYFTQGTAPNYTNVIAIPDINGFSTSTLLNSVAPKRDTILLTKELADSILIDGDNSSIFSSSLTIPVDNFMVNASPLADNTANANSSGIMATTMIYKPMIPFNANDTVLDFAGSGSNSSKHNLFATSRYSSSGTSYSSVDGYNCAYNTSWEVRYGQTVLGIVKSYIPNSAYTTYNGNSLEYFINIPNYNVGVDLLKNEGIEVAKIYPNPSSMRSVNIDINTLKSSEVSIVITDMNGKTIKETQEVVDGSSTINIELSDIATGIYNVTISHSGLSTTERFVLK